MLKTAARTFYACAALRRKIERMPPRKGRWVCLRPIENPGAAFGLPIAPRALPALSAASLVLLLRHRRKHPTGVGLILGGGLSNLWERVSRGKVRDYLQFPGAPGKLSGYVFNLADLAVFTGTLTLLTGEKRRKRKNIA